MGRKTRSGPIKSFIMLLGPRFAWMGAFTVFVTSAITFYYSVVAGWTARYAIASIFGEIPEAAPGAFWLEFTSSLWPILTHAFIIGATVYVVSKGVQRIEKVTNILMPVLLGIILILVVRSLFLPGASEGLSYLFTVDWAELGKAQLWIEALTQNAWDTGAGWGLVLCYAIYMREKEDTALNAFILPTTNNLVSLMAAIMVFCTVFSIVPQLIDQAQTNPEVLKGLGSLETRVAEGATYSTELLKETIFSEGNSGITFIWMPQLFKYMGFGQVFMIFFFLGLAFAAFSSMIAQVEVMTRAFVDAGVDRKKAIKWIGIGSFLIGMPSAIWLDVFSNQDWVWGVALMISGLFFALSITAYGVKKFREEQLNHENSNIKIGPVWDILVRFIAPILMGFLFIWFLYQAWDADPEGWLAPFATGSVGTVLLQIGIVIIVLIGLNKWIVKKTMGEDKEV